jgi:hypothetical protein
MINPLTDDDAVALNPAAASTIVTDVAVSAAAALIAEAPDCKVAVEYAACPYL